MDYAIDAVKVLKRIIAMDYNSNIYLSKAGIAVSASAVCTFLFSKIEHELLLAIFILICIDWALGLIIGAIYGQICSRALVKGIIKISIYVFLLCTCNALLISKCGFSYIAQFFSNIVYIYILLTETISILENLIVLSLTFDIQMPFLDVLLKYIQLQEKNVTKNIIENMKNRKKKKNDAGK